MEKKLELNWKQWKRRLMGVDFQALSLKYESINITFFMASFMKNGGYLAKWIRKSPVRSGKLSYMKKLP